jgi:hypothetical protein
MTARNEDIAKAIRLRSVNSILGIFFEKTGPILKQGFRTETDLWDYKRDVPHLGKEHANSWAHLAKDVLSFYNVRGGVLLFGLNDGFDFTGASQRLDSKLLNDQLRRYLPDTLWVEFHREFIQADQRYLGVALVPPHAGSLGRFTADAPEISGTRLFLKGWAAIREGDSSRVLQPSEIEEINRKAVKLHVGQRYYVDENGFRVPAPDYIKFIYREQSCAAIEAALMDKRTSVAHVIGIGGVGKTALATWAAIRAYEHKQFSFIVFSTAKDRELTTPASRRCSQNLPPLRVS